MGDENNKKDTEQVVITEQVNPVDDNLEASAETSVDDSFEKRLNEHYDLLNKSITDAYDTQIESTNKAYDAQIGGYDEFLDAVGKQKEELSALDEAQAKRAKAYKYISGIGDVISGVANLAGTISGAANIGLEPTAPGIMQKAEAMRKERKLELDKLTKRMDELMAQKKALTSSKELKLGELAAGKASSLATAEMNRLRGLTDIQQTKINADARVKQAETSAQAKRDVQESKNENPTSTSRTTPKYEYFAQPDGTTLELNVTNIKDYDKTARSIVDAAIAQEIAKGTNNYFTPADIETYNKAVKAAEKGEPKALEAWYKKHRNNKAVYDALSKASKWTKK